MRRPRRSRAVRQRLYAVSTRAGRPCAACMRINADAASSQVGSWDRQVSQAWATESGLEHPSPLARSRARASRASCRAHSSRSRGRTAHSAWGSPSNKVPSSATAATRRESRSRPGSVARAAPSASSWISRSTSSGAPGRMKIWLLSASMRRRPGSPRSDKAERAIDSVFESALTAAVGPSVGNSSSHAASWAIRCPGLTSTSWHRRRALGRGHVPALLSPRVMANGPRSLARNAGSPKCASLPASVATTALSHLETHPGQKERARLSGGPSCSLLGAARPALLGGVVAGPGPPHLAGGGVPYIGVGGGEVGGARAIAF